MTNAIQNASIFKSGNVVRIYPGYRLSDSDLVTKTYSSITKMYGSPGPGISLTSDVVVTIKDEVLAEMHEVLGTKDLLYFLPVSQREYPKISEELEAGNYRGLSMEVASFKRLSKDVKIRKGTSSKTVLAKVQEAIAKIDGMRDACEFDLSTQCLNKFSHQFAKLEADYEEVMIGMIDRNPKHFDEASAGKASDLTIKIEGLKAQLAEARNQLQALRNEQVLKFADVDGKINQHPIREEVLEKISEKAQENKFFESEMGIFR